MSDSPARPTKLCKKCKTEIDKAASVCPNCRAKQGPGCLVWAIGVIVVLGLIGSLGGENDDPAPPADATAPAATEQAATPEPAPAPVDDGSIKAGMHKIGTDMPAGEYVLITNRSTYFQVTKDSSGSFDSILCNDNFENRSYITVVDGQYLDFSDGKAYPTASAPAAVVVDGTLPDGMYRVGVDLPAGEYKVSSPGDGYMEVSRDSTHSFDSILTNDNFTGEKYISLKDGQYIKINRASIILP